MAARPSAFSNRAGGCPSGQDAEASRPWRRRRRRRRSPSSTPIARARRAGLLRPVRRPLRRRDADAADPGAGPGLRGGQGRPGVPRRARPTSTPTTPDGRARSISPSGSPSIFVRFLRPPAAGRRQDLLQARRAQPHRQPQDQQLPGPDPARQAHGQDAHHRRDRRRPARRRGGHRVRPLRPAVRDLHGRRRRRAPEAQRVPHEAAGRQGQRRHLRRADAEGRHERGAARLGHQRARHLLHHRHGRRPASLSRHGARLPVASSATRCASRCRRPRAACPIRSLPASAAAPTPSACSIRSSTTGRRDLRRGGRRPRPRGPERTLRLDDRRPARRAARQPHVPAAERRRADPRGPFDLGRPRLSGRRARAFLAQGHGRVTYVAITDKEALEAFQLCTRSKASSRRWSRRTRWPT